jgi:hypothetical protein
MEQQRLQGTDVHYGQIIQVESSSQPCMITDFRTKQLQHVHSGKLLTILPRERAEFEKQNVRVTLEAAGSEGCWLQLLPGFKMRQEGEPVRFLSLFRALLLQETLQRVYAPAVHV